MEHHVSCIHGKAKSITFVPGVPVPWISNQGWHLGKEGLEKGAKKAAKLKQKYREIGEFNYCKQEYIKHKIGFVYTLHPIMASLIENMMINQRI